MKVLVPFTTGVEEIEFVAVVDILRRAGIEVVTASLDGQPATGRSNITIAPDSNIDAAMEQDWEMIVLPGGQPNANLLCEDARVKAVTLRLKAERKSIAAICAAPTALAAYGVIEDQCVTSFPACQADMEALAPAAVYVDEVVVEDDFLITSRGAGTAVEFALRLISRLCGEDKSDEIRNEIVAQVDA